MSETLSVIPHGAGSVEWQIRAPHLTLHKLIVDLLWGLVLISLPAACFGTAWHRALLSGVAAAATLALLRFLLGVKYESLIYERLVGVQLTTVRRCGLWSSTRFVPLWQLQGIIIHEEVTSTNVHFYIGLPLAPDSDGEGKNGGTAPGGGGGGRQASGSGVQRRAGEGGGLVEVVFPRLRPGLALLRKVYQQLQPLLQTDLDAVRAELDPGTPPATPAEVHTPR